MNLRQLEAFRTTIRCGSITKAAKSMNISQPSVSRLIADLEQSVGFPLFARIGRGLVATDEGQEFYRGVEGMLDGVDHLQSLATLIRKSRSGVVSIGTIQSVATTELPAAIGRMYRDFATARFVIQSRNTPAIIEAVQLHQFDLGIVGRGQDHDGVEILFQTSAPYVCLIPEDHRLAFEHGPIDLTEIADRETFVTFGGAYPDEMMSIDSRLSKKLQNRSRLSAANAPVAAALVRETGALAIADPFSAEQAVCMGGVVFRPVVQNLTYFVTVVAAGRKSLSGLACTFVEQFSQQLLRRVREVQSFASRS